MNEKKIILTVHRPEPSFCGVVRLDQQAEALVKQLQRETGMSAKYIVSQIIIQGFDLVEVAPVAEERIDAMLLKELLAANRVRTLAELEELGYFSSSSLYPSPNFRIAGEKLLFLYNPAAGVGPYDADVATVVGLDLDALSLLFSENSPLRRVEE